MRIAVIMKQVPDLVEDVEVDARGTAIDRDGVRWTVNEFDGHALEQAMLLKEAVGAEVTVLAVAAAGIDQVLFAALARGADRAIVVPTPEGRTDAPRVAAALAPALTEIGADLVLTGVQAADDLHGQLGPILAASLGWPHVSVVCGAELHGSAVVVQQEYSGGRTAALEVDLPAVLGVQAAGRPPRYVPISRLRQVIASATIGSHAPAAVVPAPATTVTRLAAPAQESLARMLEGSADDVARQIVEALHEHGLVGV